jgi:hypothetical protein
MAFDFQVRSSFSEEKEPKRLYNFLPGALAI